MPFFSRVEIRRLAGIVLIAGTWMFTQPPLTALPQQAKSAAKSLKTEARFFSRAWLLAKRGSLDHSGWPSAAAQRSQIA